MHLYRHTLQFARARNNGWLTQKGLFKHQPWNVPYTGVRIGISLARWAITGRTRLGPDCRPAIVAERVQLYSVQYGATHFFSGFNVGDNQYQTCYISQRPASTHVHLHTLRNMKLCLQLNRRRSNPARERYFWAFVSAELHEHWPRTPGSHRFDSARLSAESRTRNSVECGSCTNGSPVSVRQYCDLHRYAGVFHYLQSGPRQSHAGGDSTLSDCPCAI